MTLQRPQNSRQWATYFQANEKNLLPIQWLSSDRALPAEIRTIADSIKVFQLGESSEGKHLISLTRSFASERKDDHLEDAMKRFIAEEQRHAHYLGTFMDRVKIGRARRHWTDQIFRYLRRLWNLELTLAVLLAAELVARVYYRALYHATSSGVLKQICKQLLKDEVMHVYFHTHLLRRIRTSRSRGANILWDWTYRLFLAVTLLAVWSGHHTVFRTGGFSFLRYWKTANQCCNHALRLLAYEPVVAPKPEVQTSCAIRVR